MLSNAQKKLIRSLEQKKYRDRHGLFVVEGPKAVREFLKYQEPEIFLTDLEDIKQVSFLKNPQSELAVFRIPNSDCEPSSIVNSQLSIVCYLHLTACKTRAI